MLTSHNFKIIKHAKTIKSSAFMIFIDNSTNSLYKICNNCQTFI